MQMKCVSFSDEKKSNTVIAFVTSSTYIFFAIHRRISQNPVSIRFACITYSDMTYSFLAIMTFNNLVRQNEAMKIFKSLKYKRTPTHLTYLLTIS